MSIRRRNIPVFFALLMLGGCLVTIGSQTTHNGVYVSQDTFNQIKPGSSTVAWVQAVLGPPTSMSNVDTDQVWKYVYTEHTASGGAVFLIFGGSSSNEKTETVFFEFKDGVVINKWRDH